MHFVAVACRTGYRRQAGQRARWQGPFTTIASTAETPTREGKRSALNPYRLAVQYGIGQLATSRFEDLMECASGHTHPLRAFFLMQVFNILKPYRLNLFQRQRHHLQAIHRHSRRLEERYRWYCRDLSQFRWSWHVFILEATIIISDIC
jgi:hypothetical protein